MAREEASTKRRIQLMVRESSCPGLIANLSQIPEGDENVFIRAVLTEWFSLNSLSGNSADVAQRLVDKYRIVEFRNANGIRGEVDPQEPPSSFAKPSLSAEVAGSRRSEETIAVVSAPIPTVKADAKVAPTVPLTIQAAPAMSAPASRAPVATPSLDIEFDPDTF